MIVGSHSAMAERLSGHSGSAAVDRSSRSSMSAAEGGHQLAHVRQRIDRLDLRKRPLNAIAGQRQLRAVRKLGVQLVARKRTIGAAAVSIVGGLYQRAAVGQIDF